MTAIPPLPPGVPKDTPDPPPGIPNVPIASMSELRVGDVVQVATMFDEPGQGSRWWKRFVVVLKIHSKWSNEFTGLNLKMRPNLDPDDFKSDVKRIGLAVDYKNRPQVVTKLPEPWPQGVAAMHMKLLAQRIITIGDE